MKAFVSALTLGLIVAFSAPAFAGTAGGETSVSKSTHKAGKAKTAENKSKPAANKNKPIEKKPMY